MGKRSRYRDHVDPEYQRWGRRYARFPGVAECAVIGVADDIRGEYPKACVVLEEGASVTEKQVREHCSKNLAAYMVPRAIEFVAELPKNALGKVQKHRMKAGMNDAAGK